LLVLAIGRLSVYFTTPINSLLMTINKHPAAAWISIFETILTAAFCWILIPKFGVKGAAFAIALPFIVGRLIILPVLTAKLARINFLPLAWRLLIFVLVTAIFALGVRYELQWFSHLTLLQLILVSPIVLLMQLCVGILLWDKQERAMMLAKVKGKLQLLKFQGVNRV
jgi:O-antigen/teichoic acid export membrane protein